MRSGLRGVVVVVVVISVGSCGRSESYIQYSNLLSSARVVQAGWGLLYAQEEERLGSSR